MTKVRVQQRKRISNGLYEISRVRHKFIPIDDIDKVLRDHGLKLIQEDGTDWSGIFCGISGNCIIAVADLDGVKINSVLALQWYKEHDQSTFEINCYLS